MRRPITRSEKEMHHRYKRRRSNIYNDLCGQLKHQEKKLQSRVQRDARSRQCLDYGTASENKRKEGTQSVVYSAPVLWNGAAKKSDMFSVQEMRRDIPSEQLENGFFRHYSKRDTAKWCSKPRCKTKVDFWNTSIEEETLF